MKGIASALALALLAGGCRGQSDREHATFTTAVDAIQQPEPASAPDTWKSCDRPSYDSSGNKWWSELTACEGDIKVIIEVDSVNLGGPAVSMTVRTRACPAGRGAGDGNFDRAVFDLPYEGQLAEARRIVKRLLTRIDKTCGGPAEVPGLLGPQFDKEFHDLASEWLDMSAEDRRKSWNRDTRI